jgi:hypothetical protein
MKPAPQAALPATAMGDRSSYGQRRPADRRAKHPSTGAPERLDALVASMPASFNSLRNMSPRWNAISFVSSGMDLSVRINQNSGRRMSTTATLISPLSRISGLAS